MSLHDPVENILTISGDINKPGLLKYCSASLKDAGSGQLAPAKPGVYKIYLNGRLMKVGKAEDGLRKRFSDYYHGVAGSITGFKRINESNRDKIIVIWIECEKEKCRRLEFELYQKDKERGEEIPWSE